MTQKFTTDTRIPTSTVTCNCHTRTALSTCSKVSFKTCQQKFRLIKAYGNNKTLKIVNTILELFCKEITEALRFLQYNAKAHNTKKTQ
jgi:hypothetical protein